MPEHRQVMVKSLIHEINKTYHLFTQRHPSFLKNGGKVSILGHSLGSVLMFDVLCHQSLLHVANHATRSSEHVPVGAEKEKQKSTQSTDAEGVLYDALTFDVENFFAVGSPLGFFLTVTGVRLGYFDPQQAKLLTVCQDQRKMTENMRIGAPKLKNLYHLVFIIFFFLISFSFAENTKKY